MGAVAVSVGLRSSQSLQGIDFPDFYCAARMLADGQGHQLYNPQLQHQYQALFAGRVGTLNIHPPFEALLYLSVAWLPLRSAYLLWSFFNLSFLLIAVRRVTNHALLTWNWRIVAAASLAFVPLLLCCIQGQDSLLLLLLVVLAFTDLRRDRAFAAGCWLALGLFKFQLILPIVLVLALTQRNQTRNALAQAFALVAFALVIVSAVVSGWSVFTAYPKFLAHLQQQPFPGIVPQSMANFRGLIFLCLHTDRSLPAIGAIALLSLAAFPVAISMWRNPRIASQNHITAASKAHDDIAFAATCLFALLVSYHANPHDLSLLLLPMSVLLHHVTSHPVPASARRLILLLGVILLLPPLHLLALHTHAYALVAIPLVALFGSCIRLRQPSLALP